MLAELIEKLYEKFSAIEKVEVIRPAAEPEHVYYLKAGGELVRREAEPAPRNIKARTLQTIADLVRDYADDKPDEAPTVWFDRQGVTLFLADNERRDRAVYELKPSSQMALLNTWERQITWMDQTSLVRTLRIYFGSALSGSGTIESFRRLKFRVAQGGEKVIEHGKASIGRSIEAELTGTSTLPEELTFHIPAFMGQAERIYVVIRCLVEIDAQAEKIALVPEVGSVEQAWDRAEEDLGRRLMEVLMVDGMPEVGVYRGVP